MTIDASVVFHYLYGYKTMRLASQDEVKAVQISGSFKVSLFLYIKFKIVKLSLLCMRKYSMHPISIVLASLRFPRREEN